MKLLYTSDIHASNTHLFSMLSVAEKETVDGIIIGGDPTPHELPHTSTLGILQAQAFYLREVFIPTLTEFKKKRNIPIYLDFGNDDFIANRHILEEEDDGLVQLLHNSKHALTKTVDIIGYMIVPPTPFGIKDWEKPDSVSWPHAPGQQIALRGYMSETGLLEEVVLDLETDETIEQDLKRLSEHIDKPFIFVAHTPPYNTPLDVIYSGLHVGSLCLRRFIEDWSKKGLLIASFHGHIHESPMRTGVNQITMQNALCFNPGQGNGRGSQFRCVCFSLRKDAISHVSYPHVP